MTMRASKPEPSDLGSVSGVADAMSNGLAGWPAESDPGSAERSAFPEMTAMVEFSDGTSSPFTPALAAVMKSRESSGQKSLTSASAEAGVSDAWVSENQSEKASTSSMP